MNIAIVDYPYALKSAVFGLSEMFTLAKRLSAERNSPIHFDVDILRVTDIEARSSSAKTYTAIFLPPSIEGSFYLNPEKRLTNWLSDKHAEGSMLCSACAGAFIIASTGLADGREVTTHWKLASTLSEHYPDIKLRSDKIIVNDGDIITAGGMMSWLDLGLQLIEQLTTSGIMHQLGKILVMDTGRREQRYYQQFLPKFTHGDNAILHVQQKIQANYNKPLKISDLAASSCLTERTFLRRFVKATGIKPSGYIQRLRIQKACDLLESTQSTFEVIANDVGYEDTSACRKAFVRTMGLTPRAFKNRFVNR